MSESIGAKLKRARQEHRLTLQQVCEATRVRVRYLEALEADDLSVMPSAVQARGFLRIYAGFLGLDGEALIREARQAGSSVSASSADLSTAPAAEASPPPEAGRQNLFSRLRRRFAPKADVPASLPLEPASSSLPAARAAGSLPEETSVSMAPSGPLVDAQGNVQEDPGSKKAAAPSEQKPANRKKKAPHKR